MRISNASERIQNKLCPELNDFKTDGRYFQESGLTLPKTRSNEHPCVRSNIDRGPRSSV